MQSITQAINIDVQNLVPYRDVDGDVDRKNARQLSRFIKALAFT